MIRDFFLVHSIRCILTVCFDTDDREIFIHNALLSDKIASKSSGAWASLDENGLENFNKTKNYGVGKLK